MGVVVLETVMYVLYTLTGKRKQKVFVLHVRRTWRIREDDFIVYNQQQTSWGEACSPLNLP
jgi:hypothetical protein